MAPEGAIRVAADNDVLLKAVCYHLTASFWPDLNTTAQVGVLGAARYVVRKRVERADLAGDKSATFAELEMLIARAAALEPTDTELGLAAEMEVAAQRKGLSLDAGESQLGAMVIERDIAVLETGDKRAICGIEHLLEEVDGLVALIGKVRCLEQIVRLVLGEEDNGTFEGTAAAVCAEPAVDKTLSICFGCYSEQSPPRGAVVEGLESYIADLRRDARRVLVA